MQLINSTTRGLGYLPSCSEGSITCVYPPQCGSLSKEVLENPALEQDKESTHLSCTSFRRRTQPPIQGAQGGRTLRIRMNPIQIHMEIQIMNRNHCIELIGKDSVSEQVQEVSPSGDSERTVVSDILQINKIVVQPLEGQCGLI